MNELIQSLTDRVESLSRGVEKEKEFLLECVPAEALSGESEEMVMQGMMYLRQQVAKSEQAFSGLRQLSEEMESLKKESELKASALKESESRVSELEGVIEELRGSLAKANELKEESDSKVNESAARVVELE